MASRLWLDRELLGDGPDVVDIRVYAASCTDQGLNSFDISFVVKPANNHRSNVAVLANVNTWLAYNGWGGESKYSGRARQLHAPQPRGWPGGRLPPDPR